MQREETDNKQLIHPATQPKVESESTFVKLLPILINVAIGILIAVLFLIFSTVDSLHNGDECVSLRLWSFWLGIVFFVAVSYRLCVALPIILKESEDSLWTKYLNPVIEGLDLIATVVLTIILTVILFKNEPCGALWWLVIVFLVYSYIIFFLVIGGFAIQTCVEREVERKELPA